MGFFGKLFGGDNGTSGAPGMPDRTSMLAMMKDPGMRKLAAEVQRRLSPAEQQELMRLVMSRDAVKIQEFLKTHLPDLQNLIKDPGAAN